jgi:hypothetical protein
MKSGHIAVALAELLLIGIAIAQPHRKFFA